jgi:serine protease Do
MKCGIIRRTCFGLSLVVCLGIVPAFVLAQETQPKPEQKEGAREPGRRGRGNRDWLQRIGLTRAPGEHERNHERVTGAFREIVAAPSKATVKVLIDDTQVALGAIVDADGYVITKASELKGKPTVQLADERRFHARLIGVEAQYDLAMLKISAEGLPVISWSDEEPQVGSFLAAPALDPAHAAIGVVSVAPRKIGAPSGMLGVQLEEDAKGPRVNQVLPGTGAEKAGVQVNDIITHINGEPIKNREALVEIIRKQRSGDTVLLTVQRGGAELAMAATLSVITPGEPDKRREFQNNLGGSLSARRDGFPLALQHDTVLRPADCGGPLVDLDGKAVGINIARGGRVNSYAIPTSAIKPLLAELKSGNLAPEVVAKKKLESLLANLVQLKTSEDELVKRTALAEEEFQKASDAEAEAKKTKSPEASLLEKLHSEVFAAEGKLKLLKAQLTKARAELKRGEAEKLVLEKTLPKE